jgi:histone acetyltransferase (RNA polymerase elongator complex component)
MNDAVLWAAGRGHTAKATVTAVHRLRQAGLEVGLQVLLGLPGERFTTVRQSLAEIISLQPDFLRIYPLLVLRGSVLAERYQQGSYQPLSLAKAVLWAAFITKRCEAAGIQVVRTGLQASAGLEDSFLAGPWHPAFGELVKARLMLGQTKKLLAQAPAKGAIRLHINGRDQSIFRGLQSANVKRLEKLGYWQRLTLQADPHQPRGVVRMELPETEYSTTVGQVQASL